MIQFFLTLIFIFAPIARGSVRIWAYGPIYILALVGFILCIFKLGSKEEISIRRTPLDIPILLFAFIAFISIFNSRYIYGSIMEIIRLIILALIFYIVVNFLREEQEIKRMLNIILMIATAIALFGILQYSGLINKSWWDNPKFLSATYVNHNHFAGLMELVIPLSVGMALSERDASKKSLYIYSFLILCIAFLLSMSRGGWLSLSVSMIIMTAIIIKKRRTRLILFIMSVLLIVTIGFFLLNAIDIELLFKRISSYRELDFSGRSEIWKGTIGLIKDNWVLGTGPGTFIYNFPKYRTAGLTRLINYAHNDYLQVASEMGIPAAGLIVFIIYKVIRKGLKTHNIATRSFKKWTSLSLTTGVLSMALHGFGDFNFSIPANVILFTVYSGLIFNISSRREREYPQVVLRTRPVFYSFFKTFTVAAMIILMFFIGASLAAEICSTLSNKSIVRNELERAERLALTAQRICPFNYIYPYRLANIYYKRSSDNIGYLREAEKKYQEALRLNPIDAWQWIGLADTYNEFLKYSLTNYDLARLAYSSYEKALALDPLNSYYLKKFAGFLLNSGDADLAAQLYKKASFVMSMSKGLSWIPVRFADSKSYLEIADMAFAAKDIKKALIFYNMAEKLNEDNENAKLGQIRSYSYLSKIKKALIKYRQVRPTKENKSILIASLGEHYLKKGYIGTAKRFTEKSISLNDENPEGYYLMQKISKKTGIDNYYDEVSKILKFNKIPMSVNFKSNGLLIEFSFTEKMIKDGKVDRELVLPEGIYEFYVKAKGQKAIEVWPHMIIRFNNKDAIDRYVNDANWADYQGIAVVNYPINRFEIIYDNDYCDSEGMQDRNLYLGGLKLNLLRY